MNDEAVFEPVIGAERSARPIDGAIAGLARRQHGVVARAQLVELGLGRRAIGHRLECGRLHAVHRGVYAVGHDLLSGEGRWMAAVLAGGPGAVLSHRSAAALWGLRASSRARIDITVAPSRRPRPGIEHHRSLLAPDEVTTVRGIPVTTVPRTLLDLASVVRPQQVERAVQEAEVRRLADALSLEQLMTRHPRRAGGAALRAMLASARIDGAVTRSELEDRFLALARDARLPGLEVNAFLKVAGTWIEVDCVWRAQRLVVELDGHAFHAPRAAFERDRARDRMLQAAGWRVVRITWRQLRDGPDLVAADLRAMLAHRPDGVARSRSTPDHYASAS